MCLWTWGWGVGPAGPGVEEDPTAGWYVSGFGTKIQESESQLSFQQ